MAVPRARVSVIIGGVSAARDMFAWNLWHLGLTGPSWGFFQGANTRRAMGDQL